MLPSILALVSAGTITEDDNTLAILQNVSSETAHTIGKWLALATDAPVYLRFLQIGQAEEHIRYTPAQVRQTIVNEKKHQSPDKD